MAKIVLTNHARQRLQERKLPLSMVQKTVDHPDGVQDDRGKDAKIFTRRFDAKTVTVHAHRNDHGDWVVISCWIDPPFAGTKDERQKIWWNAYKRAGFFGKFWLTVKKQMGL